jgi:SAM-dependent methyltransferase
MLGEPNHCSCGAAIAPARLFGIVSPTSLARSTLLRCGGCGSLYPEALPATPEAERRYDIGARRRGRGRRLARAIVDVTRGPYVDRAIPAAARRVLDFGCGAGGYLARVAHGGREAFGVDPVPPAEGARNWRWIATGDIERFAPFDWITLGHVVEHLADPAGVVSRLAAVLAPGGGLWLATPNADSFIFAVAHGAARDVDYPRHREVFARAGLERLLCAAGLDVAWVSPPRVNAVLNVATTARQIAGQTDRPRAARLFALARLGLGLVLHLLAPERRRDAMSPELIALCRLRPALPSRVR